MRDFVREGKRQYPIRELALSLVRNNAQKDFLAEIKDLHAYVRDNIRYVRDIRGIETVSAPLITLQVGQGDCDDKAVLLGALLESIGHKTRFMAVGFKPGDLSHVLIQTKIGKRWISLETTEPVPMGWHPPNVRAKMILYN